MARKRPLAVYNGVLREIKKGDVLPPDILTDTISFGNGVDIVLSEHGNGTNTFTLTKYVEKVLVSVDGLLQANYEQPAGTNQLVLGFVPEDDELVIAYCFGETTTTGIANLTSILDTTTDGTTVEYTLDNTAYNVMVFIDGILQYGFTHSNNTDQLILGFIPISGSHIQVYSVYGGSPGGVGITDHGALSGLEDDDHPQYLTEGRADDLYVRLDSTEISGDIPSYHHIQVDASNIQYIEHNLNKYPSVTIIDPTDGEEVQATTKYLDLNRVNIYFSTLFTGEVYLV